MENKKFGLVGKKLGHSHSPLIYEIFGLPDYQLYEKSEDELESFLEDSEIRGLNVTIPYKKLAYQKCDFLSETALKTGNVNTIIKKDGKLHGYNTDYYGFSFLLKEFEKSLEGKTVLILGTGGSSQTVHAVAKDQGASKIVHLSRNPESNTSFDFVDSYDHIEKYKDFQVLINTTPVGMAPEPKDQPISLDHFESLELVLDLIYNPIRTRLILDARERNIPALGGLIMLVAQAKMAAELYLDKEISEEELCITYNILLKRIENVVFVGMPGAGKTTLGSILAQKMDRQHVDIDHYIEMTTQMHSAQWIIEKGESAFRNVESQSVQKVSAMNGLVITPGGGGILNHENRIALKQNSRVYWLTRPLAKLEREGRPLSQDLEALYEARRALYESVSDHAVANEDQLDLIADKIIDEFYSLRGPVCV